MMRPTFWACFVTLLGLPALAEVSAKDQELRGQFAGYLQQCKNASAEDCVKIGNILFHGKIQRDGKLVDTHQSALVAADFYAQACIKKHAAACDRAAAIYYRADDPAIARNFLLAMASDACKGQIGRGCFTASVMVDNGDGIKRDPDLAISFAASGCTIGDEQSCEFESLLRRLKRLEAEKAQVDQNLELLDEAQELLSDPNLNN